MSASFGLHRASLLGVLLTASLAAGTASAQATGDQPTLTMGVAGGYVIGSQNFWAVPNQVILATDNQQDIFDLSRRLTGNISFSAQAMMFPSPHVGYGAEVTYFGVGTSDTCRLAQASGYNINRLACTALNRDVRSTSATSFLASTVIRPYSRKTFSPYVRIGAGLSAITDNLVAMTAYIGAQQNVVLPVYPSEGGLAIRPTGMVGLGFSMNGGTGYLVRVEARETWLLLNRVTGPSEHDGLTPPIGSTFKNLPSLLIGFDIILEKSRGRRY